MMFEFSVRDCWEHKTPVNREEFSFDSSKQVWKTGTTISKHVANVIQTRMAQQPIRKQPPSHLVMYRMAQRVLDHCHTHPDSKTDRLVNGPQAFRRQEDINILLGPHWIAAKDSLWRRHNISNAAELDYAQRSEDEIHVMSVLEKDYNPRTKDPLQDS